MLKWDTLARDWEQGKLTSQYMGVGLQKKKKASSTWRVQCKGRTVTFSRQEDARDYCDTLITEEGQEDGKGVPMTNARYWVEDPAVRAQHWAERTTALAQYYERQLAAGWPNAGDCKSPMSIPAPVPALVPAPVPAPAYCMQYVHGTAVALVDLSGTPRPALPPRGPKRILQLWCTAAQGR